MKRLLLVAYVTIATLALSAFAKADSLMRVVIEGKGTVGIHLYTEKAPKATAHIIQLARGGFYENQRFHLAIRSPRPYRVQVGDPSSRSGDIDNARVGTGGSGARIPFEDTGLSNKRGMVGLSRLPREKNSGDSQFYILLGDAAFLDGDFTVFGKVVEGMDVVDRIEKGDRITSVTVSNR